MSALVHRLRLPLFFALYLSVLLLGAFVNPGHTLALSDPITITSQTYFIHYPDFIDFTVSANDTVGTIASANISITFGPQQDQEQDSGTARVSRPAHAVTLHFKEATTGGNFHPAGTPVSYSWLIVDNLGNTYAGQLQQLTIIDSRFSWQHLSQGMLQVNWYNRSTDFGHIVLNQASDSINRISKTLGGGLLYPINLWVYATDADFHGSLAPNSYEWVGGQAIPSLEEASIVVEDSSDTTLVRDMPHELTHLIFHQLTQQGIYAPTWFDEGLAVYNQVYHEPEMIQTFNQAVSTHTLIPLNQLDSNFPADADQAYLAYAQSWQLLDFMYNTFGPPKMAQLIRQMNNPQTDFEQDLQLVLGEDQLHLENQWYISLHQAPLISPDQLTPTRQPTLQVKQGTGGRSKVQVIDSSFWLLIGLGILLIVVPLGGSLLIYLGISRRRSRKMAVEASKQLAASNAMNGQQNHIPPFNGYTDPSIYMRTSMYAQLSQQPQPESPLSLQNQEYLNSIPNNQAPQE